MLVISESLPLIALINFEALKQTDFWIAPEFLDARLARFHADKEST